MRINSPVRNNLKTHEGAPARAMNAEQALTRSIMACMLWEDGFYESGMTIADRIKELVPQVSPSFVYNLAVKARTDMKLRHAPLMLVMEMVRAGARYTPFVEGTVEKVVLRADEPAELLSMLWANGFREGVAPQSIRRGLDKALRRFDEYQLAKYKGDQNKVKLRDVFRIVHPKPQGAEQAELWRKVVKNELATPDTWEVALSANDGLSKKAKWDRLLSEGKLGALALLRNLRNMQKEGVSNEALMDAITEMDGRWALPFRYIAAARHAPTLEPALESKFIQSAKQFYLPGKTVVLVDVSGSMNMPLSAKSDMRRMDAACGVAMIAREACEQVAILSFSDNVVQVPPRQGFALRDAIVNSQKHNGTYLGRAVQALNLSPTLYDRIIVITDEQSHDEVSAPKAKGYMVNVASYRNGVGYGAWNQLDGFSEAIFQYLAAMETTFV